MVAKRTRAQSASKNPAPKSSKNSRKPKNTVRKSSRKKPYSPSTIRKYQRRLDEIQSELLNIEKQARYAASSYNKWLQNWQTENERISRNHARALKAARTREARRAEQAEKDYEKRFKSRARKIEKQRGKKERMGVKTYIHEIRFNVQRLLPETLKKVILDLRDMGITRVRALLLDTKLIDDVKYKGRKSDSYRLKGHSDKELNDWVGGLFLDTKEGRGIRHTISPIEITVFLKEFDKLPEVVQRELLRGEVVTSEEAKERRGELRKAIKDHNDYLKKQRDKREQAYREMAQQRDAEREKRENAVRKKLARLEAQTKPLKSERRELRRRIKL